MEDASVEPTDVPLDLLRQITNGFSEERKIGSGSFGKVYEGIHQDGEKIAVKMLYDMPGLDHEQFQNEFKNLSRLRHNNIVRLVGYCHDIQEEHVMYEGKLVIAERIHRALCLEYMSNGSLDRYLSDECDRYNWHTGYRIIKGICHGLKYLHNELKPPIYHLDLKPANVLLDENMVPRIADFGMSRLFGDELTRATKSSHGTIGYIPPEYIKNNLVSSKFDIFSLGVIIIKIMAGRMGYFSRADMSSQEFTNLVQENWTNRLLETSNRRKAYSEQVKICIEIGLSCVQEDRHKRPTIQDIVDRLKETETATYAARKDRSLIFEEENRNAVPQYAQDPNVLHPEKIYHGSTFNPDIEAATHSNCFKQKPGPREATIADIVGAVRFRLAGGNGNAGKTTSGQTRNSRKAAAATKVRRQVRVVSVQDTGPLDDGLSWRKYGQKEILGATYLRAYFRCAHRHTWGCQAFKQVQRADGDPLLFDVVYHGAHTCAQADAPSLLTSPAEQ